MTALSARQRRHVLDTLRRELDLYGSLPSLHKRHKVRVADRLAEMYGLTRRDILAIWETWLTARRRAMREYQRERFHARIAAGIPAGTSGAGPSPW